MSEGLRRARKRQQQHEKQETLARVTPAQETSPGKTGLCFGSCVLLGAEGTRFSSKCPQMPPSVRNWVGDWFQRSRGEWESVLAEIQFHVFVNSFLLLLTDRKQVTPRM